MIECQLLKCHQITVLIGQRIAGMSGIILVQGILKANFKAHELCPRHGVGAEFACSTRVSQHKAILGVAVCTEIRL